MSPLDDMYTQIEQAHVAIAGRTHIIPRVGIILGSGLSALVDDLTNAMVVPYAEIPGFPSSTVVGHRGDLALGVLAGQSVAAMRGRFHFYEGYSMGQITFPVRVLRALGCEILLVTNAAGALHPEWQPGDLMLLTDQIFLPGMAGHHPLIGANDERLGTRFPAMVDAFDVQLRSIAQVAADEIGIPLHSGVYAMISGPAFESGAELRLLRVWGADAVGMSTAPEVVVARHSGMRVLGISLITNLALPDGPPANHEEVLATGEAAKPKFAAVLKKILARI